jgi:hypothetical protein
MVSKSVGLPNHIDKKRGQDYQDKKTRAEFAKMEQVSKVQDKLGKEGAKEDSQGNQNHLQGAGPPPG